MRVSLAALLLLIAACARADDLVAWSDWIDAVLKTQPAEMVNQAVRKGDTRYLMVADCAEMMPGLAVPTTAHPSVEEPKNSELRKIGPTCEQILGKELAAKLRALSNYVEEYNRLMYKRINSGGSEK